MTFFLFRQRLGMQRSCEPRPAATVMLARQATAGLELFMLRRSARSAFLPEVFVFPGGAVDPLDSEIARTRLLRGGAPAIAGREASDAAHEVAAIREAFEESGVLLAARRDGSSVRLDAERLRGARTALHAGATTFADVLDQLVVVLDARNLWHFSHWITPPTESRRFDTHFYLAWTPREQAATSDEIETHAGAWISPAQALRRHAEGNFPMIFPTVMHLQRLAKFSTLAELRDYATTKPIQAVEPVVDGERRFRVPDEIGDRW